MEIFGGDEYACDADSGDRWVHRYVLSPTNGVLSIKYVWLRTIQSYSSSCYFFLRKTTCDLGGNALKILSIIKSSVGMIRDLFFIDFFSQIIIYYSHC